MFMDPYSPIPRELINGVLDAADLKPGETFLDLGSGDARLLIAASQCGALATGWEIDAELVRKSRALIEREGYSVQIHHGDFMDQDWSGFDVIYYQAEHFDIIQDKFHREKNPRARLVLDCGQNLKVVR